MRIAIGSDHAGYDLKEKIKKYLEAKDYEFEDFGAFSNKETDYPIYGEKVGEAVASGKYEKGILVCGSGVGISISANKVNGVRAVVCSEPYSALISKEHNDTNVLAIGSRIVGEELAMMIVDTWLSAKFEGKEHEERLKMICEIEKNQKNKTN